METHRRGGAAATVLSFVPADARSYGRIVRGADGESRAIVEAADATPSELAIREVNSSIYVFRGDALWPALDRLEPHNAQGELYLTDALGLLVEAGERGRGPRRARPGRGRRRQHPRRAGRSPPRCSATGSIAAHMLAGVTIVDPATTWIEAGVELEPDAVIHPFTVLRGRDPGRDRRRGRPSRRRRRRR